MQAAREQNLKLVSNNKVRPAVFDPSLATAPMVAPCHAPDRVEVAHTDRVLPDLGAIREMTVVRHPAAQGGLAFDTMNSSQGWDISRQRRGQRDLHTVHREVG